MTSWSCGLNGTQVGLSHLAAAGAVLFSAQRSVSLSRRSAGLTLREPSKAKDSKRCSGGRSDFEPASSSSSSGLGECS